jgi:beta-lactamase superfamily II metal-dependent hydrolase
MKLSRTARRILALAGIIVLVVLFAVTRARTAPSGNLQISFIDVGQGDSALLQDANGFDVLIDGGVPAAGPTVVAYLKQKGADHLEVMVASHPDSDHIGGLIDVLEDPGITVDALVLNGYPGTTITWNNFIAAATSRGLTPTVAQFPLDLSWGDMQAHVLNPASGLTNPDPNDASLVIRIDHANVRFLFPGDISSTIEATVVARLTPVSAQVLKVAHHGSKYSSSSSFLTSVHPTDAIISVGKNSYGHPAPETLQRLVDAGIRTWRTDLDGTILIVSDGVTYTISAPYRLFLFLPYISRP